MERLDRLRFEWSRGYCGDEIAFISDDTIAYVCGLTVKFVNHQLAEQLLERDLFKAFEQAFHFPGQGLGLFTVHQIRSHFAVSETCLNPSIYIYEHPSFQQISQLCGETKLSFSNIEFSSSDYLVTVSGLPDYILTLWNYVSGQCLCSVPVSHATPTSVRFYPGNWRQLCITTETEISIWTTEASDDVYWMKRKKIKVPGENEMVMSKSHSAMGTSSRATQYTIDLPKEAIAGLVGDVAEQLDEIQDQVKRMKPVSQAWTPTGHVFIGCKGGQLLLIEADSWEVYVKYNPSIPPSSSLIFDSNINIEKKASSADSGIGLRAGSMSCLLQHKYGLYAAGDDGILRLLNLGETGLEVVEHNLVGAPISSMRFNQSFKTIVMGSYKGSVFTHDPGSTNIRAIFNVHYGRIIGITSLHPGNNNIVTTREDGEMQVWSMASGNVIYSASLGIQAVCLCSSPVLPVVVIGTLAGYIYFFDCSNVEQIRIVQRLHFYNEPVTHLVYEQFGHFLVAASEKGSNIFIVDGSPRHYFLPIGYTDVEGAVRTVSMVTNPLTGDARVVVTYNLRDDEQKSDAATHLIQMDVTSDLIKSVHDHHVHDIFTSLRKDFNSEALHKLVYTFKDPTFGVCVTHGNVLYGLSKRSKKLVKFELPEKKPHRRDVEGWILVPTDESSGHQLPGGYVTMSPDHLWIMSGGKDGQVMIRKVTALDDVFTTTAHNYKRGGVVAMCFDSVQEKIFTIGFDNVLVCHEFISVIGSVMGSSLYKSVGDVSVAEKVSEKLSDYHLHVALKNMSDWDLPAPPYASSVPSPDSSPGSSRPISGEASTDIEDFTTSPTTPRTTDSLWTELTEAEARKVEDTDFINCRKELKKKIKEMQQTIQQMMKENDSRPEIERLEHHEFDLDLDEQLRVQVEGDQEINRIREEIEFRNLANLYLREQIKKECWDDMVVKGRAIEAFSGKMEVSNFPLTEIDPCQTEILERVKKRRTVEIEELQIRRDMLEAGLKMAVEGSDVITEGEDEANAGGDQTSITGSLGFALGTTSNLLHSQFDLHSRLQKLDQIILLEDAVYHIKLNFNQVFNEVYGKKELEIQKIRDKNKRIGKILQDIGLPDPVIQPDLNDEERPENVLIVKDEEVTMEKYLSADQMKKLEEERLKEAERLRLERADNWRERGLDYMMGGLLEIKKEDELKKDVPIPQFMKDDKPFTEWTDEENKINKEYERKCAELEEEREKFRKQLETELRKLQALIQEGMATFDETLQQLFVRKIKSQMIIYQEELKIIRMRYSLLQEEELETRELQLSYLQESKLAAKAVAATNLLEARQQLEAYRESYDILLAEDKILDKQFKREFNDCSIVQVENLYKLFRKRPKLQKYRALDSTTLNPYINRPSTTEKENYNRFTIESFLVEMDKPSNMPDGIDADVWDRFCKFRRQKVESEVNIKLKTNVMADMMRFCAARQEEDEQLKEEVDSIVAQMSKLKEEKVRFLYDLDVQLVLKQGQVEIDTGSFAPNYLNSSLLHRNVIEDLNMKIKNLGEKKIRSMLTSKKSRKGIVKLEWEYKRILMNIEDLQNKMKEVTSMKVTREIQSYLKNKEEYDAKKGQEITTLEQTIALRREHKEQQLKDKRHKMQALMKMLRSKARDNVTMNSQLNDLNVAVNERMHINDVTEGEPVGGSAEMRYQKIVQRSKLVDLAKAQAQEVAILRAEVERLRMRTFPALVQVER